MKVKNFHYVERSVGRWISKTGLCSCHVDVKSGLESGMPSQKPIYTNLVLTYNTGADINFSNHFGNDGRLAKRHMLPSIRI